MALHYFKNQSDDEGGVSNTGFKESTISFVLTYKYK